MNLKKCMEGLRDLLFPPNFTCDLCGAEIFDGKNLCPKCASTVQFNDKKVCPVCGRKTEKDEICLECKADAPLYRRGVSALVYTGGGAALILKFKNGAAYLKYYLGDIMAQKAETLPRCDFVAFVPITKKRRRERGYNQSKLLADVIGEKLELPVKEVLVKKKNTSDQKSLSKRERCLNLSGSFEITDRKSVKGKSILLVDDILTTGATADEVCRKLLQGGAKEIYFVTAASVEYKVK